MLDIYGLTDYDSFSSPLLLYQAKVVFQGLMITMLDDIERMEMDGSAGV